jgi:hypothetical protein
MTMPENASFMNKWFANAEALARERASDPYHNGEPLLEACTRTMLGNQASYDAENRPSAEQCHDDYNTLRLFYAASEMLTIEKLTIMQPLFAHLMTNKFLDEGFLNQFRDTNDKASRFLHFAGAASSFRRFYVTEQGRNGDCATPFFA